MYNTLKTTVLLAALTALIILIGRFFGGQQGMIIAFMLAIVLNFSSYWFSDKIVLAMYRAQPLEPHQAPRLFSAVERLTRQAGLPMPRLYILPHDSPNAFATGRNPRHAAVAVTQGLLRMLDERELEGVLAHELSHIKDRDILIGSIAATLAGAIMLLATMARWGAIFGGFGGDDDEGGILGLLLVAFLAPIAALLIQLAISRSREYMADAEAAKIAGNPYGLADALRKLSHASRRVPLKASPPTSHLFIVRPLSGRGMANLFSTHPPIEERIKRLTGIG